ncbi:DinB family protein [Daejeonella oryzae]|uniref:DinB family protein n=1 Tax=Daejeonella oryzae TaxID=1122943 RepID=UPI00047B1708|nr:DinB family protein [Daejeonella oryzae]
MNPPESNEYAPYYSTYVDTVSENVMGELEHQATAFPEFLKSISEEKAFYAYADGKWTIKEIVGHLIDTERIMSYRALAISRKDKTLLPGFDENEYVKNACFNDRSLNSLADEFAAVRKSNMFLFKSFSEEDLSSMGTASEKNVSVKALLYIIAGHLNHHKNIITERYL